MDTGYVDGDHIVNSQNTYAVELLGPVTSSSSWQSRAAQGFDHSGFPIDWQAKKAICPQGKSSRKWTLKQDRTVCGVIRIQFGKQDCLACPCRSQCTTAITNPPNLSCVHQRNLRPFKRHATANRPRRSKSGMLSERALKEPFRRCVRAFDLRRSRYIGLAKTHLQHLMIATAINFSRLLAWLMGLPLDGTRVSRFAALAA